MEIDLGRHAVAEKRASPRAVDQTQRDASGYPTMGPTTSDSGA
jgi:hypothetical protein